MSNSRDQDPDPDDLRDVLEDLRRTLDDLEAAVDRDELGHESEDVQAAARRDGRTPPRGRDVVRFTETHTIPTVISVLETTIQSLELLRGVLRLVDPDRRENQASTTGPSIDRRVAEGTERALDDLRRALTGDEVPSDPVAAEVLGEARALTSEIESLLSEQTASTASRSTQSGVVIPVDDGDGSTEAEDANGADETDGAGETGGADETDDAVDIDIDAELASIKDEVQGDEEAGSDGTEKTDDGGGDSDAADDGVEDRGE